MSKPEGWKTDCQEPATQEYVLVQLAPKVIEIGSSPAAALMYDRLATVRAD